MEGVKALFLEWGDPITVLFPGGSYLKELEAKWHEVQAKTSLKRLSEEKTKIIQKHK